MRAELIELSGGSVALRPWGKEALRAHSADAIRFLGWLGEVFAGEEEGQTLTANEAGAAQLDRVRALAEVSLAAGTRLPRELTFDDHLKLAMGMWQLNVSEDGWGKVIPQMQKIRTMLLEGRMKALMEHLGEIATETSMP